MRDLCKEALLAIESAEKNGLPKTAKYIKWECRKYDHSYETMIRKVFVAEVGERIVGKEVEDSIKIEMGKESAAEILIKAGNPGWIYWFSKYISGLPKEIMDRFTDIILGTKDSYRIGSFAADAKGLSKENIARLARAILVSKNPGSATCFAKYVHDSSLDLKLCLANIVLESQDPEWAYFFAVGVTGISDKLIEELAEVVINSRNPRYAFLFAKFLYMRITNDILKKLISTIENGENEDLGYFGGRTIKDLHDELVEIFKIKTPI